MKTMAKSTLCALYKYSGALRAQEAIRPERSFAAILLFHRVTDEIPEDSLTVSTRRFARICRMLRRNFRVVPLAEVFRLRKAGDPFPARTVAITFDDCYRDNLFAARVLAEHELPACFFIPTAYAGTDHVFDWDRGLKRMANLSWDEVREMAALGHEIGSHTVTHADMARVSIDQAGQELVDSKSTLEQQLDRPVRWFAYPFGGPENFLPERMPLVQEAGYEGLVSGFGGFLYRGDTNPIVPRQPVPDFHSLLHLEIHLRGALDWYHALRRGLKPRIAESS